MNYWLGRNCSSVGYLRLIVEFDCGRRSIYQLQPALLASKIKPPFFLTLANALLERLFSCAKGGDLFSLGRALTVNSAPTLVAMSYIGTTSVSWTKATSGDRYLCAVSHIGDYDLVGLDLSRVDETIFGPEGQY